MGGEKNAEGEVEMSDEDSSLIQTSDKRQILWIGSKTTQIEQNETEDTAGDMTQNPNHYLTDAEICHTLTLKGDRMGILFTGT